MLDMERKVDAEDIAWEYAQLTAELSELLWKRTDIRIELEAALERCCSHQGVRDELRTQMMSRAFERMVEELRNAGVAWASALETYSQTERY